MTLRNLISPEQRRPRLRELLTRKNFVRIIEAHNGISGLIGNNAFLEELDDNGQAVRVEFDGLWESSLTDSASKGYPDAEIIGVESRLHNISQILDVTNKPMIVDGDTGGEASHFEYTVKRLEALGVSAVIIEDKVFPKRNSLSEDANQVLEDPQVFATKIKRAGEVRIKDDFMIIARLESLIAGFGLEDALQRARQYLKAGVDGIMIHSKKNDPAEIFAFAEAYERLSDELGYRRPLVCVPTAYNQVTEAELKALNFNVVIYANHLMRASVRAMDNVVKSILLNKRSLEVDPLCVPVKEIFNLVGFTDVKEKDAQFARDQGVAAFIPAAGKSRRFEQPKALLKINGQSLLENQVEALTRCGIRRINVIRGFKKTDFPPVKVNYFDNDEYEDTFSIYSLFQAQEAINGKFLFINSDILFSDFVIKNLIDTNLDIVVAVDGSYKHHKHMQDKALDLVISKTAVNADQRRLVNPFNQKIVRIGKQLDIPQAVGEYIGITYFSEQGAEDLKTVYNDCLGRTGNFHEADSLRRASLTDLLQEMIDRGYPVHFLEFERGWIEIHNPQDQSAAETMLSGGEGQ